MDAGELLGASTDNDLHRMNARYPIIFLAGSGGGAPDLNVFRRGPDDDTVIEVIRYPHWRDFQTNSLSAQSIISDLALQITAKVPQGPIRIIGHSIGGHLGYGIGIHLQDAGREIVGLCAIDSFMFASPEAAAGWQVRALKQALELLRTGQIGPFFEFVRSRLWRLLIRLCGSRLAGLLSVSGVGGQSPAKLSLDPVLDNELSMRHLTLAVAAWMASVLRNPVVLKAPVVLLRTPVRAEDDAAWRERCSCLEIIEIIGQHHSLFDRANEAQLHNAFIAGTRGWI